MTAPRWKRALAMCVIALMPAMFVWLHYQPHSTPPIKYDAGNWVFMPFLSVVMMVPMVWAIDVIMDLPHWPWEPKP